MLDGIAGLAEHLEPLMPIAAEFAGGDVQLHLDKSSCRVAKPDGYGRLELHQDAAALGVDPDKVPCCVMWLPLQAIDELTPTIEVCPVLQRALPHVGDEVGYAVLDEAVDYPLLTVSRLLPGDVIVMTGLTLHRSCVRPWHSKTRMSLDLRFLP